MVFLTNPNLAYVLTVVGVTLIFFAILKSKQMLLNIGIGLAFTAVVLAYLYLRINIWAFVVVASSPFIFAFAFRQSPPQTYLLTAANFMLALGSFLLFEEQNDQIAVSEKWAWVSILSATIIWITTESLRNAEGARLSDAPNSIVGLLGEATTDIEKNSAGSVMIDGELWQARSKESISAGSMVRVTRQDGFWLTVKKV